MILHSEFYQRFAILENHVRDCVSITICGVWVSKNTLLCQSVLVAVTFLRFYIKLTYFIMSFIVFVSEHLHFEIYICDYEENSFNSTRKIWSVSPPSSSDPLIQLWEINAIKNSLWHFSYRWVNTDIYLF